MQLNQHATVLAGSDGSDSLGADKEEEERHVLRGKLGRGLLRGVLVH